jgi:hypothetical protein
MINWRLAASAILGAAVVVSCIVYVVLPVLPQRVEADQRLPPGLPRVTGHHDTAISTSIQHPIAEDHITAFERAAEAILRRAQNARASADEPIITGHIPLPKGKVPLPKKRPIPRP